MILVFSGWGILGLLVPLALGVLGHLLGTAVAPGRAESFAALGVALAGLLVHGIGRRFDGEGAEKKVADFRERRQAELHHLVEAGGFMGVDGRTRPSSLTEARAEAARLLDLETEQVRRMAAGRHTLFFLPLPWVGILEVLGGIVAAVVLATR